MDWQKTAENMKKRGFTVRRYATGAEAAEALCEELKGQEIGMGGSMTAAAHTGPASGPRPASSTPQTKAWPAARACAS